MDLAETEERHEHEMDQLRQKHEETVQQWQKRAEQLKKQLGNADVLNQQQEVQIVLINP